MTDKTKNAIRDEYDRLAASYDDRWHRYIDLTARETLERAAIVAGEKLLDAGCGSGALLRQALSRNARAAGVDLSVAMLAEARRDPGGRGWLIAGDAECLPIRSSTFDIAVSLSSFHLWPEPLHGLQELRRVLRPGGRLVLTDWCDDFLACRLCDIFLRWRGHPAQKIYTAEECDRLLRRAGFHVERIEKYKVSWLWGVMTAQASSR